MSSNWLSSYQANTVFCNAVQLVICDSLAVKLGTTVCYDLRCWWLSKHKTRPSTKVKYCVVIWYHMIIIMSCKMSDPLLRLCMMSWALQTPLSSESLLAYLCNAVQLVTCDSPAGKLGGTVCYDLRFPEMYQLLAWNLGAQIMLVPSAFTVATGAYN